MDQITEQIASHRFELQDKLFKLTFESKLCRLAMDKLFPQTQRATDLNDVKEDLERHNRIQNLIREWHASTRNPKVFERICEKVII